MCKLNNQNYSGKDKTLCEHRHSFRNDTYFVNKHTVLKKKNTFCGNKKIKSDGLGLTHMNPLDPLEIGSPSSIKVSWPKLFKPTNFLFHCLCMTIYYFKPYSSRNCRR